MEAHDKETHNLVGISLIKLNVKRSLVNTAEEILKRRFLQITFKIVHRSQDSVNFVIVRLAVMNIWNIFINVEVEQDNVHFATRVYL